MKHGERIDDPRVPGEVERSRELRRLREENAFLRAVLHYAGDILITTDIQGRITEWSGGAEKILGWTKEEVLGTPVGALYVESRTRRSLVERLREKAADEPLVDEEVLVRRKDGRKIWLSLTLATLRDSDGRRIGTVGVSKDITERKHLERELRRLSRTDKLTGLYNQAHFFAKLEVEKERAIRLGHALMIVLFDLDRFKAYNDAHGHDAGDRVLRFVGSVVFQSIRKEVDSGFRYGGDEFCCILPGSNVDGGLVFAERIRVAIEARNMGGVTASIGLCGFDPQRPGVQIVKAADAAMYRAKRTGGNQICVHERDGLSWRGGQPLAPPPAIPAGTAPAVTAPAVMSPDVTATAPIAGTAADPTKSDPPRVISA